jgi:hypothetical protein
VAVGLGGYDGVELEAEGCCAGCTKNLLVNHFVDEQKRYIAGCQFEGKLFQG